MNSICSFCFKIQLSPIFSRGLREKRNLFYLFINIYLDWCSILTIFLLSRFAFKPMKSKLIANK